MKNQTTTNLIIFSDQNTTWTNLTQPPFFRFPSDPQDERLDFGSWALEAKHHPMFFALRRDLFRLYISIFLSSLPAKMWPTFFSTKKNIYLSPAICRNQHGGPMMTLRFLGRTLESDRVRPTKAVMGGSLGPISPKWWWIVREITENFREI